MKRKLQRSVEDLDLNNDNNQWKRQRAVDTDTDVELVLQDSDSMAAFRLMQELDTPDERLYSIKNRSSLLFDPLMHYEKFPGQSKNWLVPWFSPRAEAIVAHRLQSKSGTSIASQDWQPDRALRQSFHLESPFAKTEVRQDSTVERSVPDLVQDGVAFMVRTEHAYETGSLSQTISKHLNDLVTVRVSKNLSKVRPLLDSLNHAGRVTEDLFDSSLDLISSDNDIKHVKFTPEELDEFLNPDSGGENSLYLNPISGELLPRRSETSEIDCLLSIRGALLADSYGFDSTDIVPHFLAQRPGRSLIVISQRSSARWIRLLEATPDVVFILDEKTWTKTDITKASSVVVTTYDLLMTDAFRGFYAIASDRSSIRRLGVVFQLLVARDASLVSVLTTEQKRLLAQETFQVDLEQFFRLLYPAGGSRVDVVEPCHRLLNAAHAAVAGNQQQDHKDFDEQDTITQASKFLNLFNTRLSLMEAWDRIIIENPREQLFHDFKRDTLGKFSAESFGLFRKRVVFEHSVPKSRTSVHFMLTSAKGFKWLLGSSYFETIAEARPCMDLLDFRLKGVPWTQAAEQYYYYTSTGGSNHQNRRLRRRLFTWACLMVVSHVCGLRRPRHLIEQPKILQLETVGVEMTNGEQAYYRTMKDDKDKQTAASCLPFIKRIFTGTQTEKDPDASRACVVCRESTIYESKCGHRLCLRPCLDEWQAARLDQLLEVTCPFCRGRLEMGIDNSALCFADSQSFLDYVRDDTGSKVTQAVKLVLSSLSRSTDEQPTVVCVVSSNTSLILEVFCHLKFLARSDELLSSLGLAASLKRDFVWRWDGGSIVGPLPRVLLSKTEEILMDPTDLGLARIELIMMEPTPCLEKILWRLSPCKAGRRAVFGKISVMFTADTCEELERDRCLGTAVQRY